MTDRPEPRRLVVCQACGGDGHIPDLEKPRGTWYESKTCPYCKGQGWVVKSLINKE